MTIDESSLPKALTDLIRRDHLSEAVVLSTCNRIEVYVFAETFHGAFQNVRDFLSETAHVPPEQFSDALYAHYESDAVSHLFSVACGLDSAVLGRTRSKAGEERVGDCSAGGHLRHVVEQPLPPRR